MINTFLTHADIHEKCVSAMGLGVPGRVLQKSVVDAPALQWRNIDLGKLFFPAFPFPCILENDVRLALYAEIAGGCATGKSNVLFLAIGTGLGGAVFADGKLLSGSLGSAGEIGYFAESGDIRDSVRIKEGDFGCLEKRVSGTAITAKAAESGITPQELFNRAAEKQPECLAAVHDFLRPLSAAIATSISLLNPELVILGGGVSESLEPFLQDIKHYVFSVVPIPSEIVISSFHNHAGALGACLMARDTTSKASDL